MEDWNRFLESHGYATLVALVFADQAGLPFPGELLLVAAGALAATGTLRMPVVLGLSVLASLAADLLWYELGRRRGASILGFLCRVSLEPDTCVRRTETLFQGRGPVVVVFAKFVPGLSTVAPPLAGMLGMGIGRFALLDLCGCVLWVGTFLALGGLFRGQLEQATTVVASLGTPLAGVAAVIVGGYVAVKWLERRRVLRRLRASRIAAGEVHRRLGAGEALHVVDLRSALDFSSDPRTLPGARRIPAEELMLHVGTLPRDRDIVLYCT